jgi:glutaminyl-tRNA synthetase
LAEDPGALAAEDLASSLNPEWLQILRGCKLEPGLAQAAPGSRFQFARQGYFCADSADSSEPRPVFNRTVALRDTWARIERARKRGGNTLD